MDDLYVAQEGGDHYQTEYQHWDWVTDIGMGYIPGNATKYVSRWRKKNGIADLRKAMTYVDKMIAIDKVNPNYIFNRSASYKTRVCTDRFVESNGLVGFERDVCELLSGTCDRYMLKLVREKLLVLIRTAEEAQEQAKHKALSLAIQTPLTPPVDQNSVSPAPVGGSKGRGIATSTSTGAYINHPSPFGYEEQE